MIKSLLSSFKNNYVAYNLDRNNIANRDLYNRDMSSLQEYQANLFLQRNQLEKTGEDLDKQIAKLVSNLQSEQKENTTLEDLDVNVQNLSLAAQKMEKDTSHLFNQDLAVKVGQGSAFLGICILFFLLVKYRRNVSVS